MTCIVALEHVGVAYIGSDSFLGDEYSRTILDKPKFFFKGPSFAIGFAGGLRGAQIVEHAITFRKRRKTESIDSYFVNEVTKKLRLAFSKEGANLKSDGYADAHDSNFIVALEGKICVIQSDYSIIRFKQGFASIGAGQDYAIGALAALKNLTNPILRIQTALEVAAEYSPQVCGPFHIAEVK